MIDIDALSVIAAIEDTFFIGTPVGGIDGDGDRTDGSNGFEERLLIVSKDVSVALVDDFGGLLLGIELARVGSTEVRGVAVLVFGCNTVQGSVSESQFSDSS